MNPALQFDSASAGNACHANSHNQSSYQPRSSRNSAYHRLVEDNFEKLELVWNSKYQRMYGYWRPHILYVIQKYLDCGDPHLGFARVKCSGCNTEYLLPFSCKCRGFCPSCHQRRVMEFGEYLHEEILLDVPHRQWVFTIPKRLRPYFMHNRKLLAKLSRCAWQVMSDYLRTSVAADVTDEGIKPGLVAGKACCSPMQPGLVAGKACCSPMQPGLVAGKACCSPMQPACVIAVQTFGELLNFNSHLHIIASDGCFTDIGKFIEGIFPNADDLLVPFAKAVLKMLRKEKVISLAVINNMSTWQHSGFNIHCGSPVSFSDTDAMERLARYIVRAPISQERLKYIPANKSENGIGKAVYEGKTTYRVETFPAVDFLARLVTHIPNKQEQTVRYYGYYSNKSRGMRAKAEAASLEADAASGAADNPPAIADSPADNIVSLADNRSALTRKRFKKYWARLIQKVYDVDPLKCLKCGGKMRIISFIEAEAVIKKILSHLNLWLPLYHDPPDYLDSPGCADSSLSPASSPATVSALPLETEICGNLQLNMFSHRSYEWWETGNTTTHINVNSYYNSSYNSDCEYQNPYEDEFSQEVFYDE